MPKVAVTGGAGFIGSHVVDLLGRKNDVLVLDDFSTGHPDNLKQCPDNVRTEYVNISLSCYLIEREKPEIIFHLAAQTDVQSSIRQPIQDAMTNTLGTIRVLESAKKVGAKVVFASTGGAMYGECDEPATEYDRPEPRSPYGISKLAAEGYVRFYSPNHVILRYANVWGPRQLATAEGGVMAIFQDRVNKGLPIIIYGDGEQTRDFISVYDVARATAMASVLPGGIYNVGTGVETRIIDLAKHFDTEYEFAPARDEIRRSVLNSDRLRRQTRWEPRVFEA